MIWLIRAHQNLLLLRKRLPGGAIYQQLAVAVGGTGLISLVWFLTFSEIDRDTQVIREKARAVAQLTSAVYAKQLEQAVSHLDYLLAAQKYNWERHAGDISLQEQGRAGLLPQTSAIIVTIFDRDGNALVSTLPFSRPVLGMATRDYFVEHKNNPEAGLLISPPRKGLRLRRPVIVFSRRLNDKSGRFDGVIVAAVEPGYLAPAATHSGANDGDVVAAFLRTGHLLMSNDPTMALALWSTIPPTAAPDAARAIRVEAERFTDRGARSLAWRTVPGFPMIAIAGLSEPSRMVQHMLRRDRLVAGSCALSVLLALISIIGSIFLWKRSLSRRQIGEITAAYRVATENAHEGFFMFRTLFGRNGAEADFVLEDCNDYAASAAGLPRDEIKGRKLSALHPNAHFASYAPICTRAMECGYADDELAVTGEYGVRWFQRRMVRSGAGLAVTISDITHIKAHEALLEQQAKQDNLTGLPNRHWLMLHLSSALAKAREESTKLAVVFVDLDDFKNLNDTLGHNAGDELLRSVGKCVTACLRPEDAIARIGGDEFTIVIPDVKNLGEVEDLAERIIQCLREPFAVGDGLSYTVSSSIGISMFPDDSADEMALLKHADIAMYEAKRAGKGQYRFFDSALSDRLVERLTLQSDLKRAVEESKLVLHYQPRVDTWTGEILSVEALLRWFHPLRGTVPPNEFIALAEETGLILPLGAQVIEMACQQLAAWRSAGLQLVPISVNVSPYQLNSQKVSKILDDALRRFDVPHSLLQVEVTESEIVRKGTIAAEELKCIRSMGIKVFVDDFGTGYSSLSQLRTLEMDGLKIDRAFTASITHGSDELALFQSIVWMGHAIRMRVVAEGVETFEELACLASLGCEEVQGYFIARPVDPLGAASLLKQRFLFSRPVLAGLSRSSEVALETSEIGVAGKLEKWMQ